MPTDTTPNLGLPLPHQDNTLLTDVARLRSALGMIDTALFAKATPADIDNAIAAVIGGAPGAGGGGAVAVSGSNQAGGAGQPGAVLIEY